MLPKACFPPGRRIAQVLKPTKQFSLPQKSTRHFYADTLAKMEKELLAAGDNKRGALFNKNITASPVFVTCEPENIFSISEIVQIATSGAEFVVLLSSGLAYISKDGRGLEDLKPYLTKMAVNGGTIFGTDVNECFYVIGPEPNVFEKEQVVSFAVSPSFVCVINKQGECKFARMGEAKATKLIDNAVVVGCTSTTIFVSTRDGLFMFEDGKKQKIEVPEMIIDIACSEINACFIDCKGSVYRNMDGVALKVFGLPPVVSVSMGIQHVAAVTVNGWLYVWGFNPSGQLGIGSDRPLQEPKPVLKGISYAVCGAQNTWVLRTAELPNIPPLMDRSVLEERKKIVGKTSLKLLPRAECVEMYSKNE